MTADQAPQGSVTKSQSTKASETASQASSKATNQPVILKKPKEKTPEEQRKEGKRKAERKKKEEWGTRVRREFRFRRKILRRHDGPKIHHFNWEGMAVDGPSNTDPEVSLFVMMRRARTVKPGSSKEIWLRVVMSCALRYVDPVIIMLRNGADIPRYPEGLLRYARGRTFKFYSAHGSWYADPEDRDGAIEDDGDPDFYIDSDVGIGNGFIDGTAVDSRWKWYRDREALQSMARNEQLDRVMSKKAKAYKPSKLSNCVASDDM